jgi:predicted GNAT family N-acyltransferase
MAISSKVFTQKDSEYWLSLILRYKILRHPLGLTYSKSDLSSEDKDFHLGLYDGDRLLACMILSTADGVKVKLRQVAVDDSVQGKGYGSHLQKFAEGFARQNGYVKMYCHARKTAVAFYEKAGFEALGEEFTEVGIPHYYMEKEL